MKRPAASTQLWSFAMELEPIVTCIRQSAVPAFWAGSVMGSRLPGRLEIALALAADCERVTVDS
jgi:hypothetical protein